MRERAPDGHLRVFISSTMDDLVNERDGICRRLREFNFEPVNAEGWSPDGSGSWERIRGKIASSDVFVLVLGERYGWTPPDGPDAETGKSVTHLEYDEARACGLPILPFVKELKDGTDHASPDAKKRDELRNEVLAWRGGLFRGVPFRTCYDLADQVGLALVTLLSEHYQRDCIAARARARAEPAPAPEQAGQAARSPALPPDLVEAVRTGRAILLAGAGVSLSAGLPSASAFAVQLAHVAATHDVPLDPSAGFATVATQLEAMLGRARLVAAMGPLLRPPQGVEPTFAHRAALELFPLVVTTNYDDLFEQAAASLGGGRRFVHGDLAEDAPEPVVVKLHGSFAFPETLVFNEREVVGLDRRRRNVWQMLATALRTRPVVIVGSSLRDPSILRLLDEAGDDLRGWLVVPRVSFAETQRLREWRLTVIEADADAFLAGVALAVTSR